MNSAFTQILLVRSRHYAAGAFFTLRSKGSIMLPNDTIPAGCFGGTAKYRTKDGQEDYVFSFERQSTGKWRAYILRQPSYNGREETAHASHRLSDGPRKYVCWLPEPTTLPECKRIAAYWADTTQNYRRTGVFR